MNARVASELEMLRSTFADVEYHAEGDWFLIPSYPLGPASNWTPSPLPVAFHAQPQVGQAPYGIWIPSGARANGQEPGKMKDPAKKQPPFPGRWAVLSWSVDGTWRPNAELTKGSNLLNFALGFNERFDQGA